MSIQLRAVLVLSRSTGTEMQHKTNSELLIVNLCGCARLDDLTTKNTKNT